MKPRLVVGASGILETALLPYHLIHLRSFYDVEVHVALSNKALDFVSPLALQAITKNEVYHDNSQFSSSSQLPMHLELADCDRFILYPASARVIAECALGVISCAVTRLFAFMKKDAVVVVPFVHPNMTASIYMKHLVAMEELGVQVLREESLKLTSSGWRKVEEHLHNSLGLSRIVPPTEVPEVGDW